MAGSLVVETGLVVTAGAVAADVVPAVCCATPRQATYSGDSPRPSALPGEALFSSSSSNAPLLRY